MTTINCPIDNAPLSLHVQMGIRAQSCQKCNGCWLGDAEVREAFAKLPGAEARWDVLYERVQREGKKTGKICKACGGRFLAIPHRGVEVDVCSACGGMWFDFGELRRFMAGKAQRPVGAAVAAGAAGAAALGAAGLAGAAGTGAGEENKDSQGTSIGDAVGDVISDVSVEVVGDVVGGVFSFIGDLFSGL